MLQRHYQVTMLSLVKMPKRCYQVTVLPKMNHGSRNLTLFHRKEVVALALVEEVGPWAA
jgi:hypothetical protein